MTPLKDFYHAEDGATAIEYGLIVSAVGLAVSVVVFTIGADLTTLFNTIAAFLT